MALGLEDLTFVNVMSSSGSTVRDDARVRVSPLDAAVPPSVACVFADARSRRRSRAQPRTRAPVPRCDRHERTPRRLWSIRRNPSVRARGAATHARYGTTQEQLGAIAVAQRQWALMNPRAQMKKPMTLEDHHARVDRGAVPSLRLLSRLERGRRGDRDHGGARTRSRAAAGVPPRPPPDRAGRQPVPRTRSSTRHRREGVRRAGASPGGHHARDIDILELYDCYTYTVLVTLEDYGFCAKGEGGAFVEDGKLGPGGSLPTNTGGGQLSAYYMWGFTPLSEAVIQARGQGGERQVEKNDIVLVERQRRGSELPLDDDHEQACRLRRRSTSEQAAGPGSGRGERAVLRRGGAGRADAPALPVVRSTHVAGDTRLAAGRLAATPASPPSRVGAASGRASSTASPWCTSRIRASRRGALRHRHCRDSEGVRFNTNIVGAEPDARDRDAARGRVRGSRRRRRRAEVQEHAMSYEYVIYEKKNRIAYVTINRPEVMNAMNTATHVELREIWEDFRDDADAWVAILTGAGDRAFSTATTSRRARRAIRRALRRRARRSAGSRRLRVREADHRGGPRLLRRGGFETALACDLIVAADTRSSRCRRSRSASSPAQAVCIASRRRRR